MRLIKQPIKQFSLATCTLLVLLGTLSHATVPCQTCFNWDSFNPRHIIEGFIFVLSFGAGLPVWLSTSALVASLMLLFTLFYLLAQHIVK